MRDVEAFYLRFSDAALAGTTEGADFTRLLSLRSYAGHGGTLLRAQVRETVAVVVRRDLEHTNERSA
jgi:hypothetical protein